MAGRLWLLLLLLPTSAAAAPPSTCSASVQGDLAFGTYDPLSPAPLPSTARVRLSCPKGLSAQVLLSSGNSGTFTWRELRSTSAALRYNVYQDAGGTVVWGDGSEGSSLYTSGGGNEQLILYGRIPPAQDVPDGIYSDALTLTLVF